MQAYPTISSSRSTPRLCVRKSKRSSVMPENQTSPPAASLHELTQREAALLTEIEELGRTIEAAKAEIAALRVDDITGSHIPFATDELDAIVAHTAQATHEILESCETLDAVAADASSAHGEK